MRNLHPKRVMIALLPVSCVALVSCSTTDKPEPTPPPATTTERAVTTSPARADGTIIDVKTISATVTGVDHINRRVTLMAADGETTTFKVAPEVADLTRIHDGDWMTATITEELLVQVRRPGTSDPAWQTTPVAISPRGARPGVMMADTFDTTATIQRLDTVNRIATLSFTDRAPRTVSVRPDVDLTRYRAGDNVIIRLAQPVAIMIEKP